MTHLLRLSSLICIAALFGVLLSPTPAVAQDAPFITVWDTENPGGSQEDQITIPGEGNDYKIIWEEVDNPSNTDTTTATNSSIITFPNPGVYRVKISGDFTRIHLGNPDSGVDADKIVRVEQWGDIQWSSMKEAFEGASNLNLSSNETPDLSAVEDMASMFAGASSLTGSESRIGDWDVSNVTDMQFMFSQATLFNQDIGSWNVSSVTNMGFMFQGASSFNQDLGGWDVSSVTDMEGMFGDATDFNGSIGGWEVSSVTDMDGMFRGANSFNQDLGNWEVSNVTGMNGMFRNATNFNGSVGGWDVSSVTNIAGMFQGATNFNREIDDWNLGSDSTRMTSMFQGASSFNQDLGGWNVSGARDMGSMFEDATSFNGSVGEWDVSGVDNMGAMFSGASSFNQDLGDWDVSSVTSMGGMFGDATDFNGSIGEWEVSSVSNMRRMFEGASSFNRDIGGWEVSSVTNMGFMFQGASSFNQDLGGWDVSSVTDMEGMFGDATDFNGSIGGWEVSSVTNMGFMFQGASSFNRDIGGWDVSSVSDMGGMFREANNFDGSIGGWEVSGVTDMNFMFRDATNFNRDIGGWDVSSVASMRGMFSGASSFNQDIGNWDVSAVTAMNGYMGGPGIFNSTALSSENYDRILAGWSGLDLQENILFGALGVEYCDSEPFQSHLVGAFSWSIDDFGKQDGCPEDLAGSGSESVFNDGSVSFSNTNIEITLDDVGSSGRITTGRFNDAPRNVDGISESKVSHYRVVVLNDPSLSFSEQTEIHFAVSDFEGIDNPNDVTIYSRAKPGYEAFESLPTDVDDNGSPDDVSDDTISATATEGFGEFVFASDSNPLPAELASFEGMATEDGVRLTWQTASETGNVGFQIQRKTEASGWKQLGYVESKTSGGSTSETNSYEYTAQDLPVGAHRFRLKQVDVDGSSTIHGPITAKVRMKEALMLTAPAPNPAQGSATVFFAVKGEARATVNVYNMLGQQVATLYDGTLQAGERQRVQVDASTLPSGTYFVRLRSSEKTATQQLTIVR